MVSLRVWAWDEIWIRHGYLYKILHKRLIAYLVRSSIRLPIDALNQYLIDSNGNDANMLTPSGLGAGWNETRDQTYDSTCKTGNSNHYTTHTI